MHPILFAIGHFHVYSFSIFLILAWLVWSFLFWKSLRSDGVDEDKIFDLTFYATIVAFIVSRAVFVYFHWALFATTFLKIVAIWVQPGFSLYGALIGAVMTLILLSRQQKVRVGHVLDAFALSLPGALFVGLIGALLDGTTVGKLTNLPWAIRFVGFVGRRHPIEVYEMIAMLVVATVIGYLRQQSIQKKWPYGVVGVWFFILFCLLMFPLEFFKESHVYWNSLSANQWVLVALFAEAVGAFYVRGGGRELIRPIANKIYAKFSKRRS